MSSSGWKAWAVAAASCALLFGCVADEGGDGAADDGTGQPEAGIRLDMGAGGAGGEGGEGGAGGMGGQGGEGGMGG
ncbi:MAG: hypothetical protein KC613_15580, partial [Myxococcales bacterium]|nr:hypothetical protein [Myxococcales bacterium]